MAELLGINIDRLFAITFAFGSGMAAIGGGLGAEFLGLDPQYALKYLVFFLIVVAVGGLGSIPACSGPRSSSACSTSC